MDAEIWELRFGLLPDSPVRPLMRSGHATQLFESNGTYRLPLITMIVLCHGVDDLRPDDYKYMMH